MLKPSDISKKNLSKNDRALLEKQIQSTDLSYLASIAFEQFNSTDSDIDTLNTLVDKRVNRNSGLFGAVFIAVLCGLLIGISVFFVIFQKSKTHPSVFQLIEAEKKASLALQNKVSGQDTLFPVLKSKPIEHYLTVSNIPEETISDNSIETLPSIPLHLETEKPVEEDVIYKFSPNAPVIFIHGLKVTNYRMYYFKQNESIELLTNTGLPAQYGSKSDVESQRINKSSSYFAHKIIQKAMLLFNAKHIVNCIEELTLLYDFNKNDANAQFYLGMSYYLLGKYAVAQNFFEKNLDNVNNIFHQESEFYLALCLWNTKRQEGALKQLKNIASNKGFYSTRARDILEQGQK
ncbi:MAG: hypothetical protein V4565_02805 [Bacteroidota bacterium]